MFGKNKNFNPYNQFASKGSQQLYEEEYQQSDAEPLVEQLDAKYQPTEKQVRVYAIETLGMSLPEDEALLDIAREGIIAPLPPNWLVYQSRDGEVYYKHRITQQKTYDHPTDLQYRSKYEQMKEKAARKNLKSMNLKASNSNNNASNIFASQLSNSNFIGASNMMHLNSDSAPIVKLDPKKQKEYQEQLQMQEERMKLNWKQFQQSERKDYQNREKRMRQEYESQKSRMSTQNSKFKLEEKLQQEKEQIKRKLEQNYLGRVSDELKIYERQAQNKTTQFNNIYQEDNRFKIKKYQQEKNQEVEEREKRLDQLAKKAANLRDQQKKDRQKMFMKLKQQLQSGSNKEIQEATIYALQEQLNSIKQEYSLKIKEKREELERQYNETKRLLGHDHNSYLSELAAKKTRIKTISQQKMESIKNKQIQSLSNKFQNSLDEQRRILKETLESKYSLLLEEQRARQQQKITKDKQKIDKQFEQKSNNQIANIYEELKLKIKGYQTEMNKKLSATQQKFITDIYDKSKGQSKDIVIRLQIKEKEMLLQSRNFMIDSLKRQMDLQKVTFQLLKLQSQVCKCSDEKAKDDLLTKVAKKYDLQYRSDEFLRQQQLYKQMRLQYKKDKQFLGSIMNSLQGNNRRGGVGGTALLKQYNQDVRIMRQNQQQLKKIENLLKKAEYNDKNAIEELINSHFEYKHIQLSKQMPSIDSERQYEVEVNQDRLHRSNVNNKSNDIELTLKQHSHFLTTMRHELNRKLYQIRSNIYY